MSDFDPNLFQPSPYLDDRLNRKIVQSEVEGGAWLTNLKAGEKLEVQTENRVYLIEKTGDNEFLISGHPEFCPTPTPVNINGSTWGGSMIRANFVGRNMRLEFKKPDMDAPITTSVIQDIRMQPKDEKK